MLLAQDFLYYWQHRGHHVVRLLWACHVVHHSSRRFNLTTALRQPWTGATSWPFYLPMIALGVHPAAVALCSSVNLVYQFWIHTERVDRLPRPFEYLFNTPPTTASTTPPRAATWTGTSAGCSSSGTGRSAPGPARPSGPSTALTKNIETYNPLRVATHEYAAIARDLRAASDWRERAGRVFRGPGWQPGLPPPPAPEAGPVVEGGPVAAAEPAA